MSSIILDIKPTLSDVSSMASDKHGSKVTVRVAEETLPAISAVMKDRGILKLSDFIRQAIANEIKRAKDEAEIQTLHQAVRRKQAERDAMLPPEFMLRTEGLLAAPVAPLPPLPPLPKKPRKSA